MAVFAKNEAVLGTDSDNDDCLKVASKVAGVSLESDSLPETPNITRTARRKKRLIRRPRSQQMDVDPQPSTSYSKQNRLMEWDGADSCPSSSSGSDADDSRAVEADDEQSDWVGYSASTIENDFDPSADRRTRRINQKVQMSQLQKRLERFALEGGRGEMGIEFRIKDRPNSAQTACEELTVVAYQRVQQQKICLYSVNLTSGYKEETFDGLPVAVFWEANEDQLLKCVGLWYRGIIGGMKVCCSGHTSFMSSAAGQCAIYGYTAYSPTKFALRGFAKALHMKLLPYKINVSVLFPPNTDTAGFKVELGTVPEEVHLISSCADLISPQNVAETYVANIEAGEYTTTIGTDEWMLS
uniref:Phosducin domain-containing protein n=1 Tax=Heterorhabditis bacteriophora TaxID=37862 RepID=A0A1I7XV97_HETBA